MRCPGKYYPEWRQARIHAILDHYGEGFFRGKTLLEVGCGDGSIGNFFYYLGAIVTCSDARQEFLDEIEHRNHQISVVQCDLDTHWPIPDDSDVVLHQGVLYHLGEPEASLRFACRRARNLILDTEVSVGDTNDPTMIPERAPDKEEREIDDHCYGVMGCRPTVKFVEDILEQEGMEFERVTGTKYDGHQWPPKLGWESEQPGWVNGQRRMWFCKNNG